MPSETLTVTDGYWVGGSDSFTVPDKLAPGEVCFSMNTVMRGGIVQTRPGSATLLSIPGNEFQGFSLYTPASGVPHQVAAVDGYVYVSPAPFTEYRRLPNIRFSPTSRFVAMESCLKSTDYTSDGGLIFINKPYNVLVMQDGATRAAFWDGSVSRHLNPTPGTLRDSNGERITQNGLDETFIGLWMKWSGNRLWVSRDGMLFASDIGNPLKFTEAQYINEGRAFYLPGECTGMIETPEQDGLIVFTIDNGTLFQTSIQDRTKWLETPNFQKIVFSNIGCASPLSLVKQYGLIWWFSPMGLINSDQAFSLNRSSRIDIQDNEMMCSKGNIGPDISGICTCSYENYLLCSVPSGDVYNRHTWCLDQAVFEGPLNAWNSYWTGWRPFQWAVGNVNGVQRVFFASKDYNGCLKIWEANIPDRKDNGAPVTCFAQFRQNDFGRQNQLKRFTYAELNIQEILGDVSLMVAVGGRKGGYTRILTKEIAATEGGIYGDSIYDINTCMYGHRPQTRIVRTQENVAPTLCNKGGIEAQQPNDVDLTFGLLVVWSGRMGVAGYLAQATVFEDQAAGNCEADEENPNSLSEQGCADKNYFVNTCAFPLISGSGSAEYFCTRNNSTISEVGTASSIISQVDADRKAYWVAYNNAVQECRFCVYPAFGNTRQRYTAFCPEDSGPAKTVVIAANTYRSYISQADADQQAYNAAVAQATAQLGCGLVTLTGDGAFGDVSTGVSEDRIFTLKNNGTQPVDVTSIELSPLVDEFSVTPQHAIPYTLSPDEEMIITVTALSADVENSSTDLIVNHTGTPSPLTSPISASFTAAAAAPDAFPGLVVWLDATTIVGKSDGDTMGSGDWVNLAPTLMVMNTPGPGPTYKTNLQDGLPGVRFVQAGFQSITGAPDLASMEVSRSMFIVAKVPLAAFSGNKSIAQFNTAPGAVLTGVNGTTNWDNSNWGGTAFYYKNGILTPSGSADIPNAAIYQVDLTFSAGSVSLVLGNDGPGISWSTVDIFEVAVYVTILTPAQRAQIVNGFKAKWGIA